MKTLTAVTALAALIVLTACGTSPETEFFSLVPTSGEVQSLDHTGAPFSVATVELPAQLDRRSLVVRTGETGLDIRDAERWGGAFDTMVRETLALDLANRLEAGAVVLPGEPKPAGGTRPIVVVIERFSAGPDGKVALWAQWSLLSGDGQTEVLSRTERIAAPAASLSGADIAEAMSQALGTLATHIAKTLASAGG